MEKDNNKSKSSTPQLNGEPFLLVFLLLLVVGLPIIISIWDIGSPVKGYHS